LGINTWPHEQACIEVDGLYALSSIGNDNSFRDISNYGDIYKGMPLS